MTTEETAARQFLKDVGIDDPAPDVIGQLLDVFVPCLLIIHERGYDPNGQSWRQWGWRGQLVEIRKRCERLWFNSWKHNRFDTNNAFDIINYAGFYLRLGNEGEPFGEFGSPGTEGE